MIIEDISDPKVSQSDDKGPYYYKNRILQITTDIGTFETPARVNTRSEYDARSGIGLLKILPRNLAIDFRLLDKDSVTGFMHDEKKSAELIGLTRKFNDVTRRAIFRISIFQPTGTALNNMTSKEKIEFADAQADFLQIKLGTNLITFPYLGLPFDEFRNFIDTHYRRDEHFSTIFTLDLGMEYAQLEKTLNYLTKNNVPQIIALIYTHNYTVPKRRLIASFFEKKIAFFMCQVPREELETHTSNLHAVAFGDRFDLVSLEQARPSFPDEDEEPNLNKIKFFDPKSLTINSIQNTLSIPNRSLIDELNLPTYDYQDLSYVPKMLNHYNGALLHDKKRQMLFYLARTHEAITSPPVFDTTRERIKNGEMLDYIKETNLKEITQFKNRI